MQIAALPVAYERWLSLGTGIVFGLAIGFTTRLVSTSRIAFGPYALHGNGALAVPAILVPIVLFAGWTALLRGRADAPVGAMVLFVTGIYAGIGLAPALLGLTTIQGLLFLGALFVLPPALLAALTVALFRTGRLPTTVSALSAALLFGVFLPAFPPLAPFASFGAAGISAGATTIAASRTKDAGMALTLGAALAFLVLAQIFAVPLLFSPLPPAR